VNKEPERYRRKPSCHNLWHYSSTCPEEKA